MLALIHSSNFPLHQCSRTLAQRIFMLEGFPLHNRVPCVPSVLQLRRVERVKAVCLCPSSAGRNASALLGFRPTGRRMVMRWLRLRLSDHSWPFRSRPVSCASCEAWRNSRRRTRRQRATARPDRPRSDAEGEAGRTKARMRLHETLIQTVAPATVRATARPQGPRSEAKHNGGISPEDRAPGWACGTQEKATRAALEANHHPHFRLTSPAKSVLGATDHFGDHPSETAADRNMPVLICGLDGEKRFPAAPLRPCQFEPLRSSFPCQTDLALSHERRGDLSRSSAPIRGRPQ